MGEHLLLGVLGLLAMMAGLVGSMSLTARAAARSLGIHEFRWLRLSTVPSAWWRLALVWGAAALAPVMVSLFLFWLGIWSAGVAVTTMRIDVLAGPAQEAGVVSGDRVVSLGGRRLQSWEELRSHVQSHSAPFELEVDRAGERLRFTVTPVDGKIGVVPVIDQEPVGPLRAAQQAWPMPWQVVEQSARGIWQLATGRRETGEVRGTIGIVKETSKAQQSGSLLYFLGVLSAYAWPFLASLCVMDALTTALFCATHRNAGSWSVRAQRLARLQQTLIIGVAGSAALLSSFALTLSPTTAGLAATAAVISIPAALLTYPLLWVGGNEVWRRHSVWLLLLLSALVPCVACLALFDLLITTRRQLGHEGFRVRWFSAEPGAVHG